MSAGAARAGRWRGPSSTRSYFLRVCCLRACSRWRAPVLDPAPMEKAGVDEPGSRKVAQVSAASLRARTGCIIIPVPEGMEGFATPKAQQVPPMMSPKAQPGPSTIPSPRGQHDHQLCKAKAPTPSLPKEALTPPKPEAGALGVPKERLLLPLPTAPGMGVLCPKVGAGVPGKQYATVSRGWQRRKSLAFRSWWHPQ